MALQGNWFDGKTSACKPVELVVDDAGDACVFDTSTRELVLRAPFALVKVSSRIGNTPRYLHFPDRQKFETRDHQQVDDWLRQYRSSRWQGLIHKLESHIYFVALTLALVVAFTYGMIVYGLPSATRYIAFKLPPSLMNRAATETLQFLDKTQLSGSELAETTQLRLQKKFKKAIAQNPQLHIKVIFRKGNAIGANAFALPDGTVLFTDEIVHLAKNDDELLAVLAHEIGHVKYRHALRAAIQGSVVSFGVAMLTGDLSAASNLLATLPVVVTTMAYSRDFEREADNNSLIFLDANHIARHHFVDLMERLTYQAQCKFYWDQENPIKDQKAPAADRESIATKDVAQNATKDVTQADVRTDAGTDTKESDCSNQGPGQSCDAQAEPEKATDFDLEAHRAECDKLIAEHKNDFFHSRIMGYFASHPETKERTSKFKENRADASK